MRGKIGTSSRYKIALGDCRADREKCPSDRRKPVPERPGAQQYPRLFSEFRLRGMTIANRVVFAPSHSSWTRDRFSGVFGPEALPYYVERAKGGVGLIIIGATM